MPQSYLQVCYEYECACIESLLINDFILLVVFQVGVASTREILPYIAVVPVRKQAQRHLLPSSEANLAQAPNKHV